MRLRRSKIIFIAVFLSLASSAILARAPLGAIKGTYSPLKEEFKRLSPLSGVVWWHSNLIQAIYRFGDGNPFYSIVRSLFFEGNSFGQFTITQNDKYPAYYIDSKGVATIIKTIEGFITKKIITLSENEEVELKKIIKKGNLDYLI